MLQINSKHKLKKYRVYIQGSLLSPGKTQCLWLKTTPMMMAASPVGRTPSTESPSWSCSPPNTQVHFTSHGLLFSERLLN